MTEWTPEEVARRPSADVAVDCHVHLFPDELFGAIGRWFTDVGWELPYPCGSAGVIEYLDSFGVQRFWALPYAHKPGIARGLNTYLADLARRHRQVVPFFSVHPDDNVGAEARHALDELGSRGMKIHAEVQGVGVDDPRLDPAFDLLEKRGAPCVLHAGNAPYPVKVDRLDVRRTATRLARNPELKAVIGHLGAPQTRDFLALCDVYPNLYLEVSFTNVPGVMRQDDPSPEELAPFAQRLLFGSDMPYVIFPYARQVDAWAKLAWVQQHREAFFGGTARKLVGD